MEEARGYKVMTTFWDWRLAWWQNEVGERMQQTACSLLHHLPGIAEYPFRSLGFGRSERKGGMFEGDFWQLMYHCMATTFVAMKALWSQRYASHLLHLGLGDEQKSWESWDEISKGARKALVVLGGQGFWDHHDWDNFLKSHRNCHCVIQPTARIILQEVSVAVLLYWAEPEMWHRQRKPASEVASKMAEKAAKLRFRMTGWGQDKVVCRAFINTANLHLLVGEPTEVGLQSCADAWQSLICVTTVGHGYGRFADGSCSEQELEHAVLKIGLELGKSTDELKQLLTYHGPVYDP